tara:strand:- start:197 stop:1027 length:831 start_codon:yes stop_codon:yes gene_type:complete
MEKKLFTIIGNPVSHSLSPVLHNFWFNKYKLDYEYTATEANENQLEGIITKIKNKELAGANVTLPFKQKVIPFLDKLVNDAKETNSVNTIYRDNDGLIIGDNTDVYGVQAGYLKEMPLKKRSKKILVMGAGGVAPSIIFSLLKSNIGDISLSNRTLDKSIFIKKKFPKISVIDWSDLEINLKIFDIIINATSLGLNKNDNFQFDIDKIKLSATFIDTIYNPIETNIIKKLKQKKIKTMNGLNMFMYQGQKSFYIWTKQNPEIDQDLINLLESKIKI